MVIFRRMVFFVTILVALFVIPSGATDFVDVSDCSVLILGGTTAALSAAISSASVGVSTCLIEPTDWLGGQITASGVPAIDYAWHTLTNPQTGFVFPVYKYARQRENLPPQFYNIITSIGSPGKCWVSTNCFDPHEFLSRIQPVIASLPNLRVFTNTVVKRIQTKPATGRSGGEQATITAVTAIQRVARNGDGYDRFLSEDLLDWYSPDDSSAFLKTILTFAPPPRQSSWPVIDATEWGEGLALSGAPYLQGADERFDGDVSGTGGNETCGQATTFGFAERFSDTAQPEPPNPRPRDFGNYYSLEGWQSVFTYRRLLASSSTPAPGDVTLQNWGKGNDNAFAYLFLSKADTRAQVLSGQWAGGVSLPALALGESLALGFHYWFKNASGLGDRLTLSRGSGATSVFGTAHGLVKLPYMRDTRRSVGVGDFVIKVSDLSAWPDAGGVNFTGVVFPDRVALGAYDVDTHPSPQGCTYPPHVFQYYPIVPFFVPLRALTNKAVGNLLVAGKTIAQSFLANSATRLHPTEWSSGAAAGATAAYMVLHAVDSTATLCRDHVAGVQSVAAKFTPARWTIEGKLYPPSQ